MIDQQNKPKTKQPDAIRDELKRRPQVVLLDGARPVFLSQANGTPVSVRFGVPQLDRKTKEITALLGAFGSVAECVEWLNARKQAGALTQERFDKAIDAVTHYTLLDAAGKQAVNERCGAIASNNTSDEKKPQQESAAAWVAYAANAVPHDKAGLESATPEKRGASLTELFSLENAPDEIVRVEMIVDAAHSCALIKRLDPPSAAQLKLLSASIGVPLEALKVDKLKHAKQQNYSFAVKSSAFKRAITAKQRATVAAKREASKASKAAKARGKIVEPLTSAAANDV